MSPNVTMSLVAKTRVYHLEKKRVPFLKLAHKTFQSLALAMFQSHLSIHLIIYPPNTEFSHFSAYTIFRTPSVGKIPLTL